MPHQRCFSFFRTPSFSILCTVVLGVIIYSNTFRNSFHFDDYPQIVDNPAIRNVSDLYTIWKGYPGRFLAYLSFALNYHWGGLDVKGYHLVSLGLHLGCSLLVWLLTLLTFRLPVLQDEKITRHALGIAFCTALIFVSHPVQTQPVNYIFQRSVLLAAFFYLGTLVLYLNARMAQNLGGVLFRVIGRGCIKCLL